MRVLLTYGFDPVNGSVVNESLLKIKSVKTVVRKLLHQVVKLSAVPINPPPPIIKKPPPKVKQPPPPPRKRVGRDDIEMKKGDWLCLKCDFMNFAKNSVSLQCDANSPKRQLLPGEWECPECNFLNYRRNVVCFHCECKRPADEFMENKMQERQRCPRTMPEKISSRKDAWNFDFDDKESDGADVAASSMQILINWMKISLKLDGFIGAKGLQWHTKENSPIFVLSSLEQDLMILMMKKMIWRVTS